MKQNINYPGGVVFPLKSYTGKLRLKGVPFFRLQVYERLGILLVEVFERVGNLSFGSVKWPKGPNR